MTATRLVVPLAFACAVCASAAAQDSTVVVPAAPQASAPAPGTTKTAHLNTGLILESLPESAVADSMLRQYQDSLRTGLEAIEDEFATKLQYLQDNQDDITPKQSQELQTELQGLQQSVQTYQQAATQQFEVRRDEYLNPIVQRVQAAIEAHAQAEGYTLVFDVSVPGALVFARDGDDITEAVIARLNGA